MLSVRSSIFAFERINKGSNDLVLDFPMYRNFTRCKMVSGYIKCCRRSFDEFFRLFLVSFIFFLMKRKISYLLSFLSPLILLFLPSPPSFLPCFLSPFLSPFLSFLPPFLCPSFTGPRFRIP